MFYSAMEDNSRNKTLSDFYTKQQWPPTRQENFIAFISLLEKSCTLQAPFKQAIHKGNQTLASCTITLLENEARSSGEDFFKTELVEVLQYSLSSTLTALRSGSANSS